MDGSDSSGSSDSSDSKSSDDHSWIIDQALTAIDIQVDTEGQVHICVSVNTSDSNDSSDSHDSNDSNLFTTNQTPSLIQMYASKLQFWINCIEPASVDDKKSNDKKSRTEDKPQPPYRSVFNPSYTLTSCTPNKLYQFFYYLYGCSTISNTIVSCAMVYVFRVSKRHSLTPKNIFSIFVTCLWIAIKYCEDVYFDQVDFNFIIGCDEKPLPLVQFESEICDALNFNFYIDKTILGGLLDNLKVFNVTRLMNL